MDITQRFLKWAVRLALNKAKQNKTIHAQCSNILLSYVVIHWNVRSLLRRVWISQNGHEFIESKSLDYEIFVCSFLKSHKYIFVSKFLQVLWLLTHTHVYMNNEIVFFCRLCKRRSPYSCSCFKWKKKNEENLVHWCKQQSAWHLYRVKSVSSVLVLL